MPLALYALTAGAFGIGVTEFVIMGLLLEVGDRSRRLDLGGRPADLGLRPRRRRSARRCSPSPPAAGRARRAAGADGDLHPRQPRLRAGARLRTLMAARVLTAFAHGTFFGVGSVVATGLVAPEPQGLGHRHHVHRPHRRHHPRRAFRHLARPAAYGWRATFWAVTLVGVAALGGDRAARAARRTDGPETEESGSALIAVLTRRPVLLGLLTTVLGFAGVFAVFTYIAPILTEVTASRNPRCRPSCWSSAAAWSSATSPAASWPTASCLVPTLLGSLAVLAIGALPDDRAIHPDRCGSLRRPARRRRLRHGGAAADVACWRRPGAGQNLASSFNIAAFNLGNASAPGSAASVIDHGPGPAGRWAWSPRSWCRWPPSAWRCRRRLDRRSGSIAGPRPCPAPASE
jgi:DHA1 family inner membrane transport protein